MNKDNEYLVENVIQRNEDSSIDVSIRCELVPFPQTTEVEQAFSYFLEKLREGRAVPSEDWPAGRTLELTLEFALVPKQIKAKFGQE